MMFYRLFFEYFFVLCIQFFFEFFFFMFVMGFISVCWMVFIGIKINIVKIDLWIGIMFGRLMGMISMMIVVIGFYIVFWFEIIYLIFY